eukprot:5581933-Amphidinium_carterae.1
MTVMFAMHNWSYKALKWELNPDTPTVCTRTTLFSDRGDAFASSLKLYPPGREGGKENQHFVGPAFADPP